MNAPEAAARLARLKKVETKKLKQMVAMLKLIRKKEMTNGFDFSKIFPNYGNEKYY